MRRLIAFPCAGETLVGTLDEGTGTTGLLIVSGGNELRIGAHRGMALLAARLAQRGVPVFRFDRRGIGDSTGKNEDFESAAPDLTAAAACFRAETGVCRVVAFGNCDAASALALFHRAAGIDALVLANPWVVDDEDTALPPAAAIRARYVERLRDPREWLRLMRGRVNFQKLARGLVKAAAPVATSAEGLAARMAQALGASDSRLTILLADRDNTAIAFRDAWRQPVFAPLQKRATILALSSASHSFARPGDSEWLEDQLLKALQ